MSIKSWWRRRFTRRAAKQHTIPTAARPRPALREFVYLDEVSLRSLLASQKGGITDSTSEQAVEASEASIAGTVAASAPGIGKAEVASRYQTTNSSTIQTSRKATVQSWFRELHEIPNLRRIEPASVEAPLAAPALIAEVEDRSLVYSAAALGRGELIEVRVTLAADPVFQLGTMLAEFSGMADDYPDMFKANNSLAGLRQAVPINRILQRLLAGLVPVRARAVDYVVVEVDGTEYAVHRKLVLGLDLPYIPLEIVGVTEHEAYWKDLRRVLFSDAEFTVLARVSRPGLHSSWTPVKLADLFAEATPDLVAQINEASRRPFATPAVRVAPSSSESRLADALSNYATEYAARTHATLDAAQLLAVNARIQELQVRGATVSDQRSAFAELANLLTSITGEPLAPESHLEMRDGARSSSGLSLFPTLAGASSRDSSPAPLPPQEPRRLIDVDFIAIYW